MSLTAATGSCTWMAGVPRHMLQWLKVKLQELCECEAHCREAAVLARQVVRSRFALRVWQNCAPGLQPECPCQTFRDFATRRLGGTTP